MRRWHLHQCELLPADCGGGGHLRRAVGRRHHGVPAGPASSTPSFGANAITTVWDWLNQLNAANFAGHNDWRVPSGTRLAMGWGGGAARVHMAPPPPASWGPVGRGPSGAG